MIISSCVKDDVKIDLGTSCHEESNSVLITKNTISSDVYYWAYGEKIYLNVVEDKYFCVFDAVDIDENITSLSNLTPYDLAPYSSFVETPDDIDDTNMKYYYACVDSTIISAYNDAVVYYAPYLSNGVNEVGITNIFYIKLKSGSDIDVLYTFAEEHNATVICEDFLPLWNALSCSSQSANNALELANIAYESGLFAASDVELYGDIQVEASYNDAYYADQWNLYGTYGINLGATHDITMGTPSVIVSIVDNSIQLDHPDLVVTNSYDATSQTSPGRLYYDTSTNELEYHGTSMTGIIGATINNNIGIVGISPNASVLPISVNFSNASSLGIARAVRYAADNGAKVISNSWTGGYEHQARDESFQYALDKGCILVQSSGNLNSTESKYPYLLYPDVIVVGNSDHNGNRYVNHNKPTDGSTYNEYLDIMAPGTSIKTLNSSSGYRLSTGTSPACAQVSAIATLMLSVNPYLSRQVITDILEVTARKLPEYTFSETEGRPNGTWNEEVGYGLVNAMDAVSLAKGYYNLISFDYTGSTVEFSVTADKDIAIIWDWETEDITEVPLISSTTRTFTHTYGTNKKRRIYIAEKIDLETDPIPVNSTALTEFVLTSGEDASDVEVKPRNTALEYIRIVGGADIASQTVSIKDLPSLKDLYLVHMPDVAVEIRNCPELLRFGSSNYIWGGPPELSNPDLPMFPVEGELLGPDNVNGGTAGAVWPDVPEPIQSFSSLSIEGCDSLKDVSLENVGITNFDFSGLPSLRYLYVSSQDDMIVGGTDSIYTLPDRSGQSTKGRIRVRGVSQTNTEYVNAVISVQNRNLISTFCSDKNWNVIWDSGVTDSAL